MGGILIAFEGIDNAGKTTQMAELSTWLNVRQVRHIVSKELTTPIGHLIQSYFGSGVFTPVLKTLLFAADRMQRLDQEIEPALRAEMMVLADRWVLSAVAYRAAEGLDRGFVLQVNSLARDPDVTVLLDIPPDEAWNRGQISNKPCHYSSEFLKDVREVYLELASELGIPVVSGVRPRDDVLMEITQAISDTLGGPQWYH